MISFERSFRPPAARAALCRIAALARASRGAGRAQRASRKHGFPQGAGRAGLLALAFAPLVAGAAERLLVVTSNDHLPYQEAVAGLLKVHPGVEIVRTRPDDPSEVARALARTARDVAIVTLGRVASAQVADAAPAQPVVHCMVPPDAVTRPGVPTVPRDVPLDTQVAALKRLLPSARTVGILFDPAHNERLAAEAAAAWKRAGLTPVLEPVAGPAALPAALTRMSQGVDVLYSIPDATVYAPEHSKSLLLFSFRHQVPMVGLSEGWVRAGALYALDWSHTDVGRYCAALALRQQAGAKAPMPPPPRMRLVANARTAAHLRVQWSDEVRKGFDKVYE